MSHLIKRLNKENFDLKSITFLDNLCINFKESNPEAKVFLEFSLKNAECMTLFVDGINTKRDVLHFAFDNGYEIPNVYIGEPRKEGLYYRIF